MGEVSGWVRSVDEEGKGDIYDILVRTMAASRTKQRNVILHKYNMLLLKASLPFKCVAIYLPWVMRQVILKIFFGKDDIPVTIMGVLLIYSEFVTAEICSSLFCTATAEVVYCARWNSECTSWKKIQGGPHYLDILKILLLIKLTARVGLAMRKRSYWKFNSKHFQMTHSKHKTY